MSKNKILIHTAFLISPLLIGGLMIISPLIGNTNLTDTLIFILEGYTAFFLLVCSYLYFKMDKLNITSNMEATLIRVYPTIVALEFSWLFLLPFMRREFGMWDS